jgi:hypothetical protein
MRQAIIIMMIIVWCSCSKGGGSDTPNPPDPPPNTDPVKAELLLPAKDAVCITGNVQSTTQSKVQFDWKDAANAQSYELSLKNLLTGATTKHTATKSEIELLLQRETPYSWSVTSLSSASSQKPQSDVWKFYNAGEAKQYYAPFPAEIIYPTINEVVTGAKITLKWSGSDVDNDIKSYDLYFGKTNTPSLLGNTLAAKASYDVDVTAGSDYYWKVVTKDSVGNTSESALFRFKTAP